MGYKAVRWDYDKGLKAETWEEIVPLVRDWQREQLRRGRHTVVWVYKTDADGNVYDPTGFGPQALRSIHMKGV